MTDDEWELKRNRAILAAFQTGRPVFADSDGEMCYVDGDGEQLTDDVGVPKAPVPSARVAMRKAARASYWAALLSLAVAVLNGMLAIWDPWKLIYAGAFLLAAGLWSRVRRRQLFLIGDCDP